MATLLGTTTYQKQVATNPAAKPLGSTISGDCVRVVGVYTILGTEAAGDVLPFFQIPVGALFLVSFMRISTDGIGGTAVTFSSIGDPTVAGRYSGTAVALTAAGTELPVTNTNTNSVSPFVVDNATNMTITGTLAGTLPATAGKLIHIQGFYRLP